MSQEIGSKDNKVVSLFEARSKRKENVAVKSSDLSADELFTDIMKKNKDVSDRMKKERDKKNKSVLRSYRIKN